MYKFDFCLQKISRNPQKLILGGVMLVTSSGPAYNKGHQTETIWYVTTGSVTLYLSEMSKYDRTKGQ